MNKSFDVPILLLIFNRPEETKRVFEKIREIKPQFLYVASDGPRKHIPSDEILCEKTRATVTDNIDWDCEFNSLFRNENLGCGKAVSEAISWFFEHVEEGIILEDDCFPHQSFFPYSKETLKKYRNNERVFHIGGSNNLPGKLKIDNSIYFSAYNHIWGWASWRRAWKHYNFEFQDIENYISGDFLNTYFNNKYVKNAWYNRFKELLENPLDTWDYQWTYTIWKNKGISILPKINLVKNIGFNENATHTYSQNIKINKLYDEIKFPLKFPKDIKIDKKADEIYSENYIISKPSLVQKFAFKLKKLSRL